MWDSSHTHTHHTINKIGASKYPPVEYLTSSLGPTLWESVSKPTWGYWTGFNTKCNDSGKSVSHKCAISQKDYSKFWHHEVVSKAQLNPVKTWCGTHHTPTHIKQSLQLGHYNLPHLNPSRPYYGPLCGVVSLRSHEVAGSALIPYVITLRKALATSTRYLKRTSHNRGTLQLLIKSGSTM